MPAIRTFPLELTEAPHTVAVSKRAWDQPAALKPLSRRQVHELRQWLESEETGASGKYLDSYSSWLDDDGVRMKGYVYRFTDKDTAFFFKIRFG